MSRFSRIERWKTFFNEHRRWGIVALLFLFSVLNNLDRQALAVLAPRLKVELGFGPVEYSYIVSAFLIAYSLGYAVCGRIIDRHGVRLVLAGALLFWSLTTMVHAAASGWMTLAVLRFLLGFGESFNSPSGIKAISEWAPPRERGFSIAVFTNGYVMGAILAPPLVVFLTAQVGWRWSFVVVGSVGLVLAALWLRNYHPPQTHPRLTEKERRYILDAQAAVPTSAGLKPTVWQLLRHPLCIGFFLAQLLTDPIAFFLNFWLPDYLHSRGLTMAMIGLIGWLPFLGADIGGPGGGALSDWLVRRNWKPANARRALMLAAACLMLFANLAVRTDLLWLSIGLIAVLFAAQSCWKANQLALIAESIPRESVATLVSLSALGGSLGGVLSNLLTGHAVQAFGYVPVFTVISVLPLTAFVALELMMRRARKSGAIGAR
jgi:ACS family hexuronate transporter-like MFS transporter